MSGSGELKMPTRASTRKFLKTLALALRGNPLGQCELELKGTPMVSVSGGVTRIAIHEDLWISLPTGSALAMAKLIFDAQNVVRIVKPGELQ